MPQGRYEFYAKLYEKRTGSPDHADDYLREPYITMEVYGRLKAAFRECRQQLAAHQSTAAVQQAIIFYAGWLGHYVGDGSQPLHTTIQYNGWVGPNPNRYTTEHGIHAQCEAAYVAAHITAKDFAARVKAPTRLAAPFADYVSYLRRSHDFVEEVYSLDKAGGFTREASSERDRQQRFNSPPSVWPPERKCSSISGTQHGWRARNRHPNTRLYPADKVDASSRTVSEQTTLSARFIWDSRHRLSVERSSTAVDAHLKPPTATILHLFRYTDQDMPVLKNIAAIAKGMSITFSEMFRPTIVENYPDGKGPLRGARIEARFRGAHVLQRDENGLEKCVACFLCAAACPSNCIYIEAAENTADNRVSGAERYAKVYNIDYNRCIFCGYCVEACPTDAITHGHGFELATFNATNLVYRKEMMLAPRPAHMGANIVFNQADVNGGAPAEMVPGS